MEKHLLQSLEWANYQKIEGKEVFELEGEGYSVVASLEKTPVGNYLMVAYGPFAEDKKALKQAFLGLQELANAKEAFFVRIEPTLRVEPVEMLKIAQEAGFKAVKVKNIEPEHTWVLDLTQPLEEILSGMESNKTRSWRNHENKKMSIRKTKNPEEISVLTKMLEGVGERDHFTPQKENHLKNQLKAGFATLYVVDFTEENGEKVPIAAALIYEHEGTSYYAHAATDDNYRKLRAGAVLLVQTIVDTKENGGKKYDFWGITTSEDPEHPWYGFTQYKKSFGGGQVDFSGTYDLIVSEGKYKLYNTLRGVNLKVRKLRK